MNVDKISAEITEIHAKIVQAFNAHDVDKIVSFIDASKDLHYVEHTQITVGWETLKKGFEEWHAARQDLTFTCDYSHVNVLSDHIAVLVSSGEIYQSGRKIQKMTWTAVFQIKEGQWKIVNAHEAVSEIE